MKKYKWVPVALLIYPPIWEAQLVWGWPPHEVEAKSQLTFQTEEDCREWIKRIETEE